MYWRERRIMLCAWLILLAFLDGGRAQLQYVLSTPASLTSGETGTACVNIIGNIEQLAVNLVLQHNGKNTTILEEEFSSPTYYQCGEYPIPDSSTAVPVALLLSAKGKKSEILERKTVVMQPIKNSCIVQLDKPIYKPSQKVLARIICLNPKFKPVNQKFTSIHLKDPSGTIIKQWKNQETEKGILSLEFNLIKDAPTGSYAWVAQRESSYPLSNWFTVEQYVPPRFSVEVDIPNTISALQEDVPVAVSAAYTYGEPVPGQVIIQYCKKPAFYGRRQNCFKQKEDICANMTGELSNGKFNASIDMTGGSMGSSGRSMQVDIVVVEEGTGIQTKESRYVWVTTQPASLRFDYNAMNSYYKREIPFLVSARLTDEQDNPIPNADVDVHVDNKPVQTVKTDSDGKIEYGIDTTDMLAPNFTVKISYPNSDQCFYSEWRDADYPTAEYTAYRFYSRSGSFLQAKRQKGELSCDQSHNIEVQYVMGKDGVGEETSVKVYYMVLSKSKIVSTGQQDIDLTNSKNGSINIALTVSEDMSPRADLMVYSILKQEIVVEKLSLDVEKCFKNKVDMTFSQEKGNPGAPAEVLITGEPESICGTRVIDSSLLLINSYERFSPEGVFGLFSYWSSGYNVGGIKLEDADPQCVDPNKLSFCDGQYVVPVSSDSEGDSYENLKDAGIIFGTSTQVRKPKVCDNNPRRPHYGPGVIMADSSIAFKAAADVAGFASRSGGSADAIETLRSNFADTFLWKLVPLDKDGHASISENAPDGITSWQGSVFCMSEKSGIGMNKYPANYTTMLPFFLGLNKPSSLIRGEIMILNGVVQNYMEHCVKVQVNLEPSKAFTAQLKEGTQDVCVCPKERGTFSWEVDFHEIGDISMTASAQTTFIGKTCDGPNDDSQPPRKDTVVESVSVEPEGVPQERTLSNLVFVKPGMKSTLPAVVAPPENVVADSTSAYVSAVGDVFGLPWENLENLIDGSNGCAEQNVAQIAPVVYTLDYLNSTGQLTEEILEKGKRKILEGYYRQLGYTSGDAYKLFRSSDQVNSWVTVLTFNALEKAKKYVEIDGTRQQQTLVWLENMQRLDTGCFQPEGTMYTSQDTDNSVHFTAFLAVTLMETKQSFGNVLLEGAMECLKNASTTKQSISTKVIMLYAFTLAGLKEYQEPLMADLMKTSISKDGTIHWEREDMPAVRPIPYFWPIYAPAEVQLTAYMLLSLTAQNSKLMCSRGEERETHPSEGPPVVSETDLSTMAQISLWLVRRQNSHGGFSSTSDTVVSLQALSNFARLLNTPNSQQTIKIKKGNGDIGSLNLAADNRLVVQRQDLPDPTGDYSLEIEGTGWCLVQFTSKYHIPIPKENSAFDLSLSASSENCLNGVTSAFNLTVNLSYRGSQNASDMTLLKIRPLSGYHPDYFSMKSLVTDKIVAKADENEKGEVEIYFESVKTDVIFSFRLFMGERVQNVQTSSAYVFSYYNPGENGYAAYAHPCVKQE